MALIIRTDKGDFDLFGSEDIVQTFSSFNLEDITGRSGEYTNVFRVPLTNNNIQIIEYANYIQSINSLPYSKITATLYVDGIPFKTGFITIDSIKDFINIRFFSGNSTFYNLVKNKNLSDLNWDEYNHYWNLTFATNSLSNTEGYTYPIVNYGGQTLSGDIVDIRKILPATFNKTILKKIFEYFGYTSIYNFDTSDFDNSLLPYSNKNPSFSSSYLLLNSTDVSNIVNQSPIMNGFTKNWVYILALDNNYYLPINYTNKAINTSTYFDLLNSTFYCNQSGNYNASIFFDMVSFNYMHYTHSNVTPTSGTPITTYGVTTYIQFITVVSGVENVVYEEEVSVASTVNKKVYLSQGDNFYIRIRSYYFLVVNYIGGTGTTTVTFNPEILNTTNLKINLDAELFFGGFITYSSMLPKLKCSEWLKDICIRFGLLFDINEDNKIININRLDKLIDNIPNKLDWTNKLNEEDYPESIFSYKNYAQNNNFNHKEDKSILETTIGSNYNLQINNSNLQLTKDIYTSPFAVCDSAIFNSKNTIFINLYDTVSGKFKNDVQPRICFSELVISSFKFTDGTTTSGYLDARRLYFIDFNIPNRCMGFASNLIPKNSVILMSTLQNLRLMKLKFNLNFIDIKNLDYFTPIYLEQFQAYFFISSINQFNYTNPNLTEVELIKLNQ